MRFSSKSKIIILFTLAIVVLANLFLNPIFVDFNMALAIFDRIGVPVTYSSTVRTSVTRV